MNINDFRSFVLFLARKASVGNNPSVEQFNLSVGRAFTQWVMKMYGNPAEFQPGLPIPRIAWQQNQVVSDRLRFLLERREFVVPNTGQLSIPNGTTVKDVNTAVCPKYLHASSLMTNYITQTGGVLSSIDVPVIILRDNELSNVLGSSIKAPTHRYPVCAFYNDYIQLYPKTVGRVVFTYLRTPTTPVWGYTIVNSRPVYNAATSVDIESPDDTINEIAAMTLSYLGISIKDGDIVNYAEQMKQAG